MSRPSSIRMTKIDVFDVRGHYGQSDLFAVATLEMAGLEYRFGFESAAAGEAYLDRMIDDGRHLVADYDRLHGTNSATDHAVFTALERDIQPLVAARFDLVREGREIAGQSPDLIKRLAAKFTMH